MLNGESYDYIGSQRLLYDIEKGSFPPKQDNIVFEDFDMIIEIGSLGGKPNYLSSHYAQNNPKVIYIALFTYLLFVYKYSHI